MTGSALYSFESHPGVAQQNIEAIIRLEQEADSTRSFSERAAELVTRVAVRPWFFAAHTLLIGACAEHFQLPPIASLSQHADLKAPTDLEALIDKIDRTRQREEQKR